MQHDNAHFRTTHAICQTGDAAGNAHEAVRKIRDDFKGFSASVIVFYASTAYDGEVLAREMQDAFPDAVTMGCTTAGEARDGCIYTSSVVAMAFSKDVFESCETALILEDAAAVKAGGDIFASTLDAMRHLGRNLDVPLINLDYKQYVGFILTNRVTPFSERVLEQIGEVTNVIFVGGVAGDDYKLIDGERVFYRGKVYTQAAALALWKPKNGFGLLKTQAADMTDKSFIITKADEKARIIWEFNGEDAVTAYARAIGKPAATMDLLDFAEYPLAASVDGEPYMRPVVRQVDGKGLGMFVKIHEGTRLTVTKAENILEVTRDALEKKIREMGGVTAILHINCVNRHSALATRGQTDDFAAMFADIPSISFASYGEVYVDLIAMTSTMILFK